MISVTASKKNICYILVRFRDTVVKERIVKESVKAVLWFSIFTAKIGKEHIWGKKIMQHIVKCAIYKEKNDSICNIENIPARESKFVYTNTLLSLIFS